MKQEDEKTLCLFPSLSERTHHQVFLPVPIIQEKIELKKVHHLKGILNYAKQTVRMNVNARWFF